MTSTEAWLPISQLPYLDDHTTIITADVDEVWPVHGRSPKARRYLAFG